MTLAGTHPRAEDLAAFSLGTLADGAGESIGDHVAACTTCQAVVATIPGDPVVDLLRRAQTRLAAAAETPVPFAGDSPTVTLTPPDGPQSAAADGVPDELAGHERYRVVALIGKGGMGSVYAAEHRVMRRVVAVKVINRAATARPAAVDRFLREVRAAAALAHPNVVTTYDAEAIGGTHFLVMERVEGTTLGRLVQDRGPLLTAAACEYVRQAALGLQHAHDRGLIHRDIKPDNLMLVAGDGPGAGVVKVLDFGLAALSSDGGDGLTAENAVMGTPDYMAPEQAVNPRAVDGRADVYSLGCTLFYLLTGRVPYPAETTVARLIAHRERPTPAVRAECPSAPPDLDRVVARLLAKTPEERYQTAAAVAAALDSFARPAVEPARPHRPWAAVARAALLATALAAAVVVYRIQTDKGELVITTESDDVEVVVKQGGQVVRIIDTKTDKQVTLRSGEYALELNGGPAGLKLDVEKATLTRNGTALARIERVAPPAPGPKVTVADEVFRKRWPGWVNSSIDLSPDGRRLASGHWGGSRVWDVATGKVVHDGLAGWLVRFTHDGKRLVTANGDHLSVYDADTGTLLRDICHGPEEVVYLVVAPDGRTVVTSGRSHVLILFDMASGKRLHTWQPIAGKLSYLLYDADGRHVYFGPSLKPPTQAWDCRTNKEAPLAGALRTLPLYWFLPGGREVLVHGRDGYNTIHEVATGKLNRTVRVTGVVPPPGVALPPGPGPREIMPLPDGHYAALDLNTGRELARFTARNFDPALRVVSKDGRYVAGSAANQESDLVVWRLPDPIPEPVKP